VQQKTIKPISAITAGAKLLSDMLRIRGIDPGGQRHNHRASQAFLVTHRKLILGSGRLAFAGRERCVADCLTTRISLPLISSRALERATPGLARFPKEYRHHPWQPAWVIVSWEPCNYLHTEHADGQVEPLACPAAALRARAGRQVEFSLAELPVRTGRIGPGRR
jgi:hypothetical protein